MSQPAIANSGNGKRMYRLSSITGPKAPPTTNGTYKPGDRGDIVDWIMTPKMGYDWAKNLQPDGHPAPILGVVSGCASMTTYIF